MRPRMDSDGRYGYPALRLGERARPHFFGEPAIATSGGYRNEYTVVGDGSKKFFDEGAEDGAPRRERHWGGRQGILIRESGVRVQFCWRDPGPLRL